MKSKTYVGAETVGHEFKLAIGRYKRDSSVVLKTRQTDTLVEFCVFQLDRLALSSYNVSQIMSDSLHNNKVRLIALLIKI